jgi:peroxiredoxin
MERRIPALLALTVSAPIAAALAIGLVRAPAAGGAAAAQEAGPRVDDFALLDHAGRFHRLRDYADARAIVVFVQGNGCPIARGAVPVLNSLRAELEPKGVAFLALNASPQDDRGAVAAEVAAYALELPVLLDETQLVAESLGVERTAETFVIEPDGWTVVYRGPVDDRFDYDAQKPARHAWLRDVLHARLVGEAVAYQRRDSPGCLIWLPHARRPGSRAPPVPDYARDVAPILERRCLACHHDAGVGPWSMKGFESVRGWAPMMREVIRTRRMPPWHADPHVGRFANDISLAPDDARTLVHWIEAGAPRGDGPDPLATRAPPDAGAWALGPPDVVVEAPAQSIPASGVVDYRYETVSLPLDRDAWIRGAEIRPTNVRVTHHATAYIVRPDGAAPLEIEGPGFAEGLFAGYVPGREPERFPDDAGFFLPRGARIRFQLHYSTTGKPETDVPRLGLYLGESAPRHELKIGAAVNTRFEIPAGARDHEDRAVRTLTRDILLYRLSPHMHYRGRRMRIDAEHPDGRRETLLNVPDYRFNWQRQYVLAEPKPLAAGTRIVATAGFDNSARNPANPDPTQPVRWGEQSFEEMLIGYFLYRDAGEP